jgi:magnesium transporter
MASARTTYRDAQDGGDGAAAHPFVWVSLRDPSPEELAAVQREFGLPAPLVDNLTTPAPRPVLEFTGQLLYAVVKTTIWVAAEEAVRLEEVQLVLGDGFVVSVDRDGAVLERVRQDLEAARRRLLDRRRRAAQAALSRAARPPAPSGRAGRR